ncbi:hypothetical protein GUJ93_ZPchr0006g43822 [Zizania palustris]|uniref:VQ domain-containing protein n=1 Tax=Zizania palustris TaxID=103762 RepID=A0A8J5VMK2_ZIZPA|nr:hypothetical protein GUJ93_ZPchr0006g43822 [Zizania palustris]KAG8072436.1 hypothetical protein GUJ93_ZPchr0006g43822 [Zizania palustris]
MFSCDHERTAAARTAFSARCQPRVGVSGRLDHHDVGNLQPPAAGQAHGAVDSAASQPQRAKKRHAAAPRPSTSSRRSSTTVVATDVSNFRAMVQELTGFPQAAIFRPLPRRLPVHAAYPLAPVHGCGGASGGAQLGHRSDTATAASSGSSPDVPTVQQPRCSTPSVFDGLPDLGSPEFDSWADFSIE